MPTPTQRATERRDGAAVPSLSAAHAKRKARKQKTDRRASQCTAESVGALQGLWQPRRA